MKPEIKPLTGLRGVAATLVMLDHYAAVDFNQPFPLNLLPHMYLAVDMFMMLSGFILAMTYGDRLGAGPSAGAPWFILRRVARLFPLYALTTLVCFGLCRAGLLVFLSPDASVPALLANLLAVQTWLWPGSSLNGPGWSISTEWFASLAFPWLVPVILGRSAVRAGAAVGLAFAVLVLCALVFGQLFDVPSPGAANMISGPGALGRCVGEFAIGMYCWRLRAGAGWTRVLAGDGAQLGLLATLFVLFADTRLDTVFIPVCALLLIGLSFDRSAVAAVLRAPVLMFLGRISYSIYLVHITLLPARDALAGLLRSRGMPAPWTLAVCCCAGAAVLLATLTWRFVEGPGRQAILAGGGKRAVRRVC